MHSMVLRPRKKKAEPVKNNKKAMAKKRRVEVVKPQEKRHKKVIDPKVIKPRPRLNLITMSMFQYYSHKLSETNCTQFICTAFRGRMKSKDVFFHKTCIISKRSLHSLDFMFCKLALNFSVCESMVGYGKAFVSFARPTLINLVKLVRPSYVHMEYGMNDRIVLHEILDNCKAISRLDIYENRVRRHKVMQRPRRACVGPPYLAEDQDAWKRIIPGVKHLVCAIKDLPEDTSGLNLESYKLEYILNNDDITKALTLNTRHLIIQPSFHKIDKFAGTNSAVISVTYYRGRLFKKFDYTPMSYLTFTQRVFTSIRAINICLRLYEYGPIYYSQLSQNFSELNKKLIDMDATLLLYFKVYFFSNQHGLIQNLMAKGATSIETDGYSKSMKYDPTSKISVQIFYEELRDHETPYEEGYFDYTSEEDDF